MRFIMTVNQLVVGSIPTAGAKINAEKPYSLANSAQPLIVGT